MARTVVSEPKYVEQLSSALRDRLPGAEVQPERVRKDRYRFIVVWKRFDRMGHPERQQKVWDIAEEVLKGGDVRKVSMILTLGERDLPRD